MEMQSHAFIAPIEEQVRTLGTLFNLDTSQALRYSHDLPNLPLGTEGWFAIWSPMGGVSYMTVRTLVHDALHLQKPHLTVHNVSDFDITLMHRTRKCYEAFDSEQKSDILIIPAQLGLHTRRRMTVNHIRSHFKPTEFGLDSVAIGCMLLANQHLPMHKVRFGIECIGERLLKKTDPMMKMQRHMSDEEYYHKHAYATHYRIARGRVSYNIGDVHQTHNEYGGATGFLV